MWPGPGRGQLVAKTPDRRFDMLDIVVVFGLGLEVQELLCFFYGRRHSGFYYYCILLYHYPSLPNYLTLTQYQYHSVFTSFLLPSLVDYSVEVLLLWVGWLFHSIAIKASTPPRMASHSLKAQQLGTITLQLRMSTLYKTMPTTVITLKTAFLLSNIRKLEAKQACVISWTQSKRNVQMKVPGVKYLCTLLVELISKRLFSRSWVSVMQMWQYMQVIMRILLTRILISPICCWGGNITQIVNIINISYLNPTHYSHFLFVKQQNLSMSMQVKHNILHLTTHPSDTDHASQLAVGKLFLDALITKILFIDVKLSQCTNSQKGGQHDRSSVIKAIQDLLEGMNYEQIAIAVGRLYAGMTQKLQYGKAVEQIVAQTVKKLSSSTQLNLSKEQSEYSVFQLNSSITSNATFKQNQSFQLDQPNNSPKYVEKQPQFQVSPTKNFLKYVEKDSQFQGSPSKNSPKYIEKTPERVKQQMPFQLDLSQIKQANGSPSINKSTTLFTNNQSPAQEPAKKHVETAKDPDPNWIPLQTVDAYLLKIPVFRSEINLVSQIMKLPPIRYYRFRYESRYYVRAEFKIAGYWTYYKPLEFYGEGWSGIYRQACEQAAYQVLRVLFMYCPELWRKFVELKRRKGLE